MNPTANPTSAQGKVNFWLLEEIKHYLRCENAKALGLPVPPGPTSDQLLNSLQVGWTKVEEMTGLRRGHTHWLMRRGAFPQAFKRPASRPKGESCDA